MAAWGNSKRRRDGRLDNQMRPLAAEFGTISAADGSAKFSCGDTSVIVAVYGPRQPRSIKAENPAHAVLDVSVSSGVGQSTPRDTAMEMALASLFRGAVLLHSFPRCNIDVVVQFLHDDGASLAAAVSCTTLALADAGLPLRQLLAGVSLGSLLAAPLDSSESAALPAQSPHEPFLLDMLLSEEAQPGAVVATAVYGSSGGSSPLLVKQCGAATTWERTEAMLAAASVAVNPQLAFLQLALKQKAGRDGANNDASIVVNAGQQ